MWGATIIPGRSSNTPRPACYHFNYETHPDSLQRFLFERSNVRGELVHLDDAWRAVLERHDYPSSSRADMGELMAAAVPSGAYSEMVDKRECRCGCSIQEVQNKVRPCP